MTSTFATETVTSPRDVVEAWLGSITAALKAHDSAGFASHFIADGTLKDMLALTWGYRTFTGPAEIQAALDKALSLVTPGVMEIAADRTPPRTVRRSGVEVVEAFLNFKVRHGSATAFVRLLPPETGDTARVWLMLTSLHSLEGREERIGRRRPTGAEYSMNFSGANWMDQRRAESSFADRAPEVLVIGGAQSGLILAARLKQMGVDALVVEKSPNVGDVWRNRYHSLTLHNEVWANHMPYMPFPDTWPTYLPKDMVAGWLEAYAQALELNVWTGTEFVSGDYDDSAQVWSARVRLSDGTERVLHPRHLVLATGASGSRPKVPELPGLSGFTGTVTHSGQFTSGRDYSGQRVLVVGTGNSGHDVAQDLHENGASVTIMQRSPTCVVSLEPSAHMVYAVYSEDLPTEDVDLMTAAIPYPVLKDTYQHITRKMREADRDLLQGLENAGFRTTYGEDDTGFHMMYLRKGGGYYIDVGCSKYIAQGEIDVIQYDDLETFDASGVRRRTGEHESFDHVVLATGFENLQEGVRQLLGDEVADRVGRVWGFDENDMMRNMWQRTGQPGFWLMGGDLIGARLHSRYLALQLAAELDGLLPEAPLA